MKNGRIMPAATAHPDPAVHRLLLAWFTATARPLPWRETREPWGILVSEVMGQQTPMIRVVPRWQEWLDRWPTPAALAAASEAEILRAWDRMGYPRRALNLRRAAIAIVERHGGEVPSTEEELLALPGIGPYTAAAVRAFAFGQRTAVLDTNVRRVLARLSGSERPPSSAPTQSERRAAEDALPADPCEAATVSEAFMELGALVCRPAPVCERCPLSARCEWLAAGKPASATPGPKAQAWAGTDRQARGRVLAAFREADVEWLGADLLLAAAVVSSDKDQPARVLSALERDGLITAGARGYRLGGATLGP